VPKIYVVGLGPGSREGLPLGTYQKLQSGLPVFLRTRVHPVVASFSEEDISFQSFDYLYESGEEFAQVYSEMTRLLLAAAANYGEIVYAVPGHPMMAEQSVQNLLREAPIAIPPVEIEMGSGQSFFDSVCTALQLDPVEGLLFLDGTTLAPDRLRGGLHTLIAQVYNRQLASEVKLTLMDVYPDDYPVTVVRAAGVPGEERIDRIPLYELDRLDHIDHLTTVYLPASQDETLLVRDPWFVANLVRRLRSPGGCPWDLKQTHQSLRPYVIEEAYEVASAIDEQDPWALQEELGDVLLQVFLHAQIGSESGDFTVRDVFQSLGEKLIRRHPHVFGDVQADSVAAAEMAWQGAKEKETNTSDVSSVLATLRRGQPAWKLASAMQERAAQVGFDWERIGDVMAKLREELQELEQAIEIGDAQGIKDEAGDLVFTIVNVLRWLNLDLETVLAGANQKFERRFSGVERRVEERGGDWKKVSMEQLQGFWEEIKNQNR